MRKFYIVLWLTLCVSPTHAQVSTAYKTQIDAMYQHVNRSFVTTGLLTDYGLYFTNIDKFNGILSDSNSLEFGEWQQLYLSLYTCKFNANATLQEPKVLFTLLDSIAALNSGTILFAGLHYKYERFKINAAPNLVYVYNNKIYDKPGRPTTPYEIKDAFAFVPMISSLEGANHTFLFKPEFFYSNTDKIISALHVNFDDGTGYKTVLVNTPISILYTTEGEKTLHFKLVYTDGSFKKSHTRIKVSNLPVQQQAQRYKGVNIDEFNFPLATFPEPKAYQGKFGKAKVTVEYTNPEKKIRKPLIVIEGFDPWKITSRNNPTENFEFNDLISYNISGKGLNVLIDYNHNGKQYSSLSDALQGEKFDLIFVDFDDGTDYIQRNAYLVENIIEWVNSVKEPYNGVMQKNIVMGASMGGLVARYALRNMELSNPVIDHDTKLYVSFDTPHQGANFPVGFQAMVSHLSGVGINMGTEINFADASSPLRNSFKLLNSPAARQMLFYSVTGGGNSITINNAAHDAFMADYTAKGYPQLGGIRNLVIANGSECGTDQGFNPHAEFVNYQGKFRLDAWAYFGMFVLGGGGISPSTFILPALTSRTDLKAQFVLNALPNQSNQRVYKGRVYVKKTVLFGLATVTVDIFDKSFNVPATYLPIDNNGGGIYSMEDLASNLPFQLKLSRFNFVPTFSALDVGGGQQTVTLAEVTRSYSPSFPPVFPKNVRAANFFANPTEAGSSNEIHTQVTLRNGRWLFQEITGTPAFFSCSYQCADPSLSLALIGTDLICSGDTKLYTVTNTTPGTTLLWSNSTNLNYVSGQGTTGYTVVSSNPTGSGFLSLKIGGECQQKTINKSVWVGLPYDFLILGPSVITAGSYNDYTATEWNGQPSFTAQGIGSSGFTWSFDLAQTNAGWNCFGCSGQTVTVQAGNLSTYVTGHLTNACGTIIKNREVFVQQINCPPEGCEEPFFVYPNPSSNELIIPSNTGDSNELTEITLINSNGTEVYSANAKNSDTLIPVSSLPKGVYFLNIRRKEGLIQRKIKIDH